MIIPAYRFCYSAVFALFVVILCSGFAFFEFLYCYFAARNSTIFAKNAQTFATALNSVVLQYPRHQRAQVTIALLAALPHVKSIGVVPVLLRERSWNTTPEVSSSSNCFLHVSLQGITSVLMGILYKRCAVGIIETHQGFLCR